MLFIFSTACWEEKEDVFGEEMFQLACIYKFQR